MIYVEPTAREIAAHLRPGQLVVLESTTYPGTTRDVVLPILQATGLTLGKDFFLAYQSRAGRPGQSGFRGRQHPQGGRRDRRRRAETWPCNSIARACREVIPVSTCEVAEACKILENTYRAVNIALVNELKMLFDRMGIDVWEVIEAAKTKPFGFQAFYPGPGLGGHCIPIDPFYLTWLARCHGMTTRFIELAGEINTGMPQYVVDRLVEALNAAGQAAAGQQGLRAGRGLQERRRRRPGKPGLRAHRVAAGGRRGGLVQRPAHPPFAADPAFQRVAWKAAPLTAEFLAGQDCVLIATDHSAYDYEFIVRHAPLVVDTRNATQERPHGPRENMQSVMRLVVVLSGSQTCCSDSIADTRCAGENTERSIGGDRVDGGRGGLWRHIRLAPLSDVAQCRRLQGGGRPALERGKKAAEEGNKRQQDVENRNALKNLDGTCG